MLSLGLSEAGYLSDSKRNLTRLMSRYSKAGGSEGFDECIGTKFDAWCARLVSLAIGAPDADIRDKDDSPAVEKEEIRDDDTVQGEVRDVESGVAECEDQEPPFKKQKMMGDDTRLKSCSMRGYFDVVMKRIERGLVGSGDGTQALVDDVKSLIALL
jgi:hypothetical protein